MTKFYQANLDNALRVLQAATDQIQVLRPVDREKRASDALRTVADIVAHVALEAGFR